MLEMADMRRIERAREAVAGLYWFSELVREWEQEAHSVLAAKGLSKELGVKEAGKQRAQAQLALEALQLCERVECVASELGLLFEEDM